MPKWALTHGKHKIGMLTQRVSPSRGLLGDCRTLCNLWEGLFEAPMTAWQCMTVYDSMAQCMTVYDMSCPGVHTWARWCVGVGCSDSWPRLPACWPPPLHLCHGSVVLTPPSCPHTWCSVVLTVVLTPATWYWVVLTVSQLSSHLVHSHSHHNTDNNSD